MPKLPKKGCSYPGCFQLIPGNKKDSYCKVHSKKVKSDRNKIYNRSRDPKIERFYKSKAWRETRRKKLLLNPLCEHCLKKGKIKEAEMVHHIKPIKEHWELRLTMSNLKSLCNRCHNIIEKRG